jgi:hypothetical protein
MQFPAQRPRSTNKSFKSSFIDLNDSFTLHLTPKSSGFSSGQKAKNRSYSHTNIELQKDIARPFSSFTNRKRSTFGIPRQKEKSCLGIKVLRSNVAVKASIYNIKFKLGTPVKVPPRNVSKQRFLSFLRLNESDKKPANARCMIRTRPRNIKDYVTYKGDNIYRRALG